MKLLEKHWALRFRTAGRRAPDVTHGCFLILFHYSFIASNRQWSVCLRAGGVGVYSLEGFMPSSSGCLCLVCRKLISRLRGTYGQTDGLPRTSSISLRREVTVSVIWSKETSN